MSATRRWPWGLVLGYALLAGVGGLLESSRAGRLATSEGGTALRSLLSVALLAVAVCGALVASRRADAPGGWLLLGLAGIWGTASLLTGIGVRAVDHPRDGLARTAAWLAAPAAAGVAYSVGRLLLTFLDGGPTRGVGRWAARVQPLALLAACAGFLLAPGTLAGGVDIQNPHGLHGAGGSLAGAAAGLGMLTLFLVGLGALVGLQVRRRRAAGRRRRQLALVSVPASTLLLGFLLLVFGPSSTTDAVAQAVVVLSVVGLGVTTAVAILRHQLYDLDVVLERATVLLGLAAVASSVYVVAVAAVGAVLGSGHASYGVSVIGTVAAALALLAVQQRMVRLARRLVHGNRATPYEALSAFGEQLAVGVSLDRVLPATAAAVAAGLGARSATVTVPVGDGERSATAPERLPAEPAAPVHEVPVLHEGEAVGRIRVELARGDRLDPTRQRLLDDLAAQAGLALHNVQLAAELEDSVAELRASRQRIVTAQDEERRKVERDLHDGAQQRLVALSLTLRMAQDALDSGAPDATSLLTQAADELRAARQELRELARGIHPAVLSEAGLAAAVEGLAERAPVPVTVALEVGRLSPRLEAALYFVVAEALTNVAKHARASTAAVEGAVHDGVLRLVVRDDGEGGAVTAGGTGLVGLKDRVAAVGGTIRLLSAPGQGTVVEVEVPCASS